MVQKKDELEGQDNSCSGAKPCRLHPNGCTNEEVLFNLINRTNLGSLHKDSITKLKSLVGRKTQAQASFEVTSIASYYPTFSRRYIPFIAINKLAPGMHGIKKLVRNKPRTTEPDESNQERSLRRTKSKIRDYVHWNNFEYFVTFTFGKNRSDISKCTSQMSGWLKRQKKKYPSFEYLIVPEHHKRCEVCAKKKIETCNHNPKPIHFHALVKGYEGRIKQAVNPKTGKDRKGFYKIPSYRSGYSTLKIIKKTEESYAKVGNYIGKYITKDMITFKNKHRYMCSSGLKKPLVEYNPPAWNKGLKPFKQYVNNFGITYLYDYISPMVGMK